MKFYGEIRVGKRNKWLDFGAVVMQITMLTAKLEIQPLRSKL